MTQVERELVRSPATGSIRPVEDAARAIGLLGAATLAAIGVFGRTSSVPQVDEGRTKAVGGGEKSLADSLCHNFISFSPFVAHGDWYFGYWYQDRPARNRIWIRRVAAILRKAARWLDARGAR